VLPGLPTLVELVKAGPVALLAAGVWYEVHEMRCSLAELSASIAVLLDRSGRDTSSNVSTPDPRLNR
jgi:hypothetical protein